MHTRLFAAAALALALAATVGCAQLNAAATRTSNQKAKKDCAACARMCEIAGESKDGSPDAVSACKQDCTATCQP